MAIALIINLVKGNNKFKLSIFFISSYLRSWELEIITVKRLFCIFEDWSGLDKLNLEN